MVDTHEPEPVATETVTTAFHCPACQAAIDYGIKRCPTCQTAIFYRDMSESFWNDRKVKLLKQTDAIHR